MLPRARPDRRPGSSVRLLAPASLLVAVALSTAPAGAAADLSRARSFTLDNGLTVVTLRDPAQPVVAVQMLYRVGARNETTGITGIAHFVEHMLFRGTTSFGLADVTGAIERAGGEWHGYTYLDCTTYFEAAPRDLLPSLLRLEAERMTAARMASEEVEPERGAVLQEYRGYQIDPRSDLFDATIAALFEQHPYRNNTMGWESDLREITHDDLVSFYGRYYGPRNAVLAIAGDFDPAAIEPRVREIFGSIPAGGASTAIRTVEPPLSGQRRIVLRRPGAAPALMISFLAPPPARARDYAALLILDGILGSGRGLSFRGAENDQTAGADVGPGSRLGALLGSGPAERLGTAFVPTLYPYHYSIYANPKEGHRAEEIEPLVFGALSEAGRSISLTEVDGALRRIEAALLLETDSPVEEAHEMAFWTGLGGLEVRQAIVRALRRVTPEEVRSLARSLTSDRAAVGILVPTGERQARANAIPEGPAGGRGAPAETVRPPAGAGPAESPPEPRAAAGADRSESAGAPRRTRVPSVETVGLAPGSRAIIDARPDLRTFVLRIAVTGRPAGSLRVAAAALRGDADGLRGVRGLGVRSTLEEPGEGTFAERDTLQIALQGPATEILETLRVLGRSLGRALGTPGRVGTTRSVDPGSRALQILAERLGGEAADGAGASGTPSLEVALVSPYDAAAVQRPLADLLPASTSARDQGDCRQQDFEAGPAGGAQATGGGAPAAGAGAPARAGASQAMAPVDGAFPSGRLVEPMRDIPQARLLFAFPGGDDPEALGALAYLLHHNYRGRLGVKAIAEMGLVYSMESEAATRGRPLAYVTMGTSPEALGTLEAALAALLDRTAATVTERELAEYQSFAAGVRPVRLSDPEKAARLWLSALLRGEDDRGPAASAAAARALTLERVAALARRALDPARRLTVVIPRDEDHS